MKMQELWTWGTEELRAAGVDNPRFTAELLLRAASGLDRAYFLAHGEHIVASECEERYRDMIRQRSLGMATQYLIGHQEFFGRDFWVSPAVLIPRPETELLVEAVLAFFSGRSGQYPCPCILDLCAGSGSVGISLAAELPGAAVTLADISRDALEVAGTNADRLGVRDRVCFVEGDLFASLAGRRFDCIVSNPPYIPSRDIESLSREVRGEPRAALDGGLDGYDFYRRIAAQASCFLTPSGLLALEVGAGQADAVSNMLSRAGFLDLMIKSDLAGIERVVMGNKG